MNESGAAKADNSSNGHDIRNRGLNLAARERRRMQRQVSEPSYQTKDSVEDRNFGNWTDANRLRQTCPPDFVRSDKEKVRSRRKLTGNVRSAEELTEALATKKVSSICLSSDSVSSEVQEFDVNTASDSLDQTCDVCDRSELTCGYCQDCKQRLCKQCCIGHRKISTTKNHTVILPGNDDAKFNKNVPANHAEEETARRESVTSAACKNEKGKKLLSKPDPIMVSLNSDSLGEVNIDNAVDKTASGIKLKEDISSWYNGDEMTETCITGIVCLDDGRLILADQGNQVIKLFDSEFHPLSSTKLTKPPWGLALTAENKVLVTIPDLRQYWQFRIDGTELQKELAIETESECLGITEVMNEVIVSTYDGKTGALIAISKHGRISRKAFVFYRHGDQTKKDVLLRRPNYLQKSQNCKVLYVSDVDIGLVAVSLSDLRNVLFVYKHTDLRCPLGVDVDHTGYIYVCGLYSHNVHQLTKTGELRKILSNKGLTPSPQCVCLCRHDNTLLLSLDKQYDLKCLQFC